MSIEVVGKKPKTRIYLVHERIGAQVVIRLVRAVSTAQVISHLAKPKFDISTASPEDVALVLGTGGKVENADSQLSLDV